ncbi:hypothetical protein IQ07DRAFT_590080 [Pyrenochaeta sp. DS3sAY3a]|nr:hypothetical protein IQ07DRAFT_590080 [Pyrenochaeta sp. DS3sAY3a]
MAGQPPPPNSQLNISPPPPSLSPHGNVPQTPRSSSIADDSDAEFEPTPIHSPGGPQYDDLPPSYDEAQQQAVADVRNGITPLDPNQIEAHRLTLNEGPDQPEIWEYRVRGEQIEPEHEHEQAPDYDSHVHNLASTVPIQHVETSSNIPVGQVNSRSAPSTPGPDPVASLLERALEFTRHEPDSDVRYAPRLTRVVAIPQNGPSGGRSKCEKPSKSRRRSSKSEQQSSNDVSGESTQFLRAYAKALHAHSIRPAEFTEFLDGLNALCKTFNLSSDDLVNESTGPVHDYIRGANEAFFAPRGLRVSLRSLPALLAALNIPSERGQRAGATASVLDPESTPAKRALALYPWVEALETNVPEPSVRTLMLYEQSALLQAQNNGQNTQTVNQSTSPEKTRSEPVEDDPPHSIPEPAGESPQNFGPWGTYRGFGGRGGRRGAPWSPFGPPGHGPFGAPGNSPFGAPGHGPFGHPGHGPFGRGRGRGLFAPRGPSHCGRGPRSPGSDSAQYQNEWAAWGESVGKWSEELGKMVGDLGQQLGKGAAAWGEDVGKRAGTWGENVGRRAGTFGENVAARASGSGTQNRNQPPTPTYTQPQDDAPPSYAQGPPGQETGVLASDAKVAPTMPPPTDAPAYTPRAGHPDDDDDDDDDASSICSSNSDSDSDSDSDSEDDYPDASALFLARIHSINAAADLAAKKGKKPPAEIASERALAIEKAQKDKTALELKIEDTQTKRAIRASLRLKGRELKKEYRRRKREMKGTYKGVGEGKGKGKGKGRAKKSREWKDARREYREQKRALKREKIAARREWREARVERRRLERERSGRVVPGQEEGMHVGGMVWIVVENLAP